MLNYETCKKMNIPDIVNMKYSVFPPYSLQKQPTRKEYNEYCQSWFPQLSCIVSDQIIIIISRVVQSHPGGY